MTRRNRFLLIIIVIIAGSALAAYLLIHRTRGGATTEPESTRSPVATVKVVSLRKDTITQSIVVYGSITPAPQANKTLSVDFESRVLRVAVFEGERVSQGEVLLEISPTPDASLELEEARHTYASTKQDFENAQKRFDLEIATIDQLLQAKKTYEQARIRFESLEKRDIHGPRKIVAETNSLVSKIHVQYGAKVPAGGPLIELAATDQLEARVGIPSENASRIHVGQPVLIASVNTPTLPAVTGRIREISRTVNPTTRMIDFFVSLPQGTGFYAGESIQGRVVLASAEGLIAPHSAVLPEGGQFVLFTVVNGRARKRFVQVGIQNEKETQVIDQTLRPGDPAVILGNYELKDGMEVRIEAAQ